MTTAHESTLEAMFYETVRENPQMAATAAEARNHILDGDFYSLKKELPVCDVTFDDNAVYVSWKVVP